MSFVHFDEIYDMCCEVSETRRMEEPTCDQERKAVDYRMSLPVRKKRKLIISTIPKSKPLVYTP